MRSRFCHVFAIAILLLSACGSDPTIPDRYYSLVLAADGVSVVGDNENSTARLIVGPIYLPDYLSDRGLPLQVGPNRIESANHHFWAEPLDEAIAKVLVRDIAVHTNSIDVERESGRYTPAEDCRLRVEFDAFHPTSESRVLTSGRYWISSEGDSTRQEFSFSRTLTRDGYAHAVDALRDMLQTLAEKISANVQEKSTCIGAMDPDAADS